MKRLYTIPLFVILCLSFCTNQAKPVVYYDQTLEAHCQVMQAQLDKKLYAIEKATERNTPRIITAIKASDAVHQ